MVSVQGNREVPRDFLLDDEVVFRTLMRGATPEVVPGKRKAPILAFVERDPVWDEPFVRPEDEADRVAHCEMRYSEQLVHPIHRFVLFLDEINRFSDGVLDGLLSVLEERVAFFAGHEFRLPVVVLMTMNPPGYDATARRLSPPLAARIGRCYTLSTPDIDTLTDVIMQEKITSLEKELAGEHVPAPYVTPDLRRKVALATLCLWGDPDPEMPEQQRKAGMEYLTPGTRDLLRNVWKQAPQLKTHARWLADNCRFGPDGRAPADWINSAVGHFRDRIERSGQHLSEAAGQQGDRRVEYLRRLDESDLLETVIDSVAHRIYDEFSPAVEPHKQARKEQAIREICSEILLSAIYTRVPNVSRVIDDKSILTHFDGLIETQGESANRIKHDIYKAFVQAGVTDNLLVKAWIDTIGDFKEQLRGMHNPTTEQEALALLGALQKPRDDIGGRTHAIVTKKELGLDPGFSRPVHEALAQSLRELRGAWLER